VADDLEQAIVAGAMIALRNRALFQRKLAAEGTSSAGEKYPNVTIRSPEAVCAVNLAEDWSAIADALEMEGPK
jgi:hypothetical protein